jgi:hypothetical protein
MAVDLVVEVRRSAGPSAGALLLGGLVLADFAVRYDGEAFLVVAVEAPPRKPAGEGAEPWSIVVYFDLGLATPEGVRWAAQELAERAAELAERGQVEVVMADPPAAAPRQVLAPSHEPERIAEALGRVVQFYRGREVLVQLRREYLAELAEPSSEVPPEEVARLALGEEEKIVRGHLDDLAAWLVAQPPEAYPGPRRALLLVSGGFDIDPAAFYRDHLAAAASVAPASPPAGAAATTRPAGTAGAPGIASTAAGDGGSLAADSESLARTLAAYGWIALCLGPPEIEEQEWGWRRKLQVRIDHN